MAFVDCRCYIAVRPALEYKIPEASKAVMDALVGEATVESALMRVDEACAAPESVTGATLSLPDDIETLTEEVCIHIKDYLHALQRSWIEFLKRFDSGLRKEIALIETKASNLKRMYHRDRSMPSDEYRRRMMQMHAMTREVCLRYKTLDQPRPERPDALAIAAGTLRAEFANMYGTVPTHALLEYKRCIDERIAATQIPVAGAFGTQVRSFLELGVVDEGGT